MEQTDFLAANHVRAVGLCCQNWNQKGVNSLEMPTNGLALRCLQVLLAQRSFLLVARSDHTTGSRNTKPEVVLKCRKWLNMPHFAWQWAHLSEKCLFLPDYGPFGRRGVCRDAVSLSLAQQYVCRVRPTSRNIVNLAPAWWSCLAGVQTWINMPRSTRWRYRIRCLC